MLLFCDFSIEYIYYSIYYLNNYTIHQSHKRKMPTLYYTDYSSSDLTQQRLVAAFLNLQLPTTQIPNKHAPLYLVDGTTIISQPNAISYHLSTQSKLLGNTFQQQIQVYSWLEYFNLEVHPLLKQIYSQIFGKSKPNQTKYNYANDWLKKVLKNFDDRLKLRSFLVGDTITLADIIICCQLQKSFRLILAEDTRKKFTNLTRWYTYLTSLNPFISCLGKPYLCQKVFQIALEDQEETGTQSNVKQVKQVKEVKVQKKQKKQKESKKKQQEPKKKPTKQSEQQEVIPQIEGQFNLDNFKRSFQNSENKAHVIDEMLSNLGQGWSIWKVYYSKDVTQGKVDYLTSNLAKGTLQRLDALRKTGFGSWGVYFSNQTQQYEIRGVMLWKGEDVATAWKEHPSHEYHLFEKLNPKLSEHAQIIKDYWLDNEICQGLTYHTSFRLI